jgi:Zn-finger nucleic acid-binding protein
MRCPVCNVTLTTADRHGVEVDYCPKCYGIWLDRGELSAILERSMAAEARSLEFASAGQAPPHPDPEAGFGRPEEFTWRRYAVTR